jgi:hypothetical protein
MFTRVFIEYIINIFTGIGILTWICSIGYGINTIEYWGTLIGILTLIINNRFAKD